MGKITRQLRAVCRRQAKQHFVRRGQGCPAVGVKRFKLPQSFLVGNRRHDFKLAGLGKQPGEIRGGKMLELIAVNSKQTPLFLGYLLAQPHRFEKLADNQGADESFDSIIHGRGHLQKNNFLSLENLRKINGGLDLADNMFNMDISEYEVKPVEGRAGFFTLIPFGHSLKFTLPKVDYLRVHFDILQ